MHHSSSSEVIGWFSPTYSANSGTVKSTWPQRGLRMRPFWIRESRWTETPRWSLISRVVELPLADVNPRRYRDILKRYVFRRIEGFQVVRVVGVRAGSGVAVIVVPAQRGELNRSLCTECLSAATYAVSSASRFVTATRRHGEICGRCMHKFGLARPSWTAPGDAAKDRGGEGYDSAPVLRWAHLDRARDLRVCEADGAAAQFVATPKGQRRRPRRR